MYKNNAKFLINRVNAINGRSYKEDPTIIAWNLINEPRCETWLKPANNDCPARIQAWIEEMATFVRKEDPNHMITIGSEGFYGATTPELLVSGRAALHAGPRLAGARRAGGEGWRLRGAAARGAARRPLTWPPPPPRRAGRQPRRVGRGDGPGLCEQHQHQGDRLRDRARVAGQLDDPAGAARAQPPGARVAAAGCGGRLAAGAGPPLPL